MAMAHDTRNFKAAEFSCRCGRFDCPHHAVDQRLMDALQQLRDLIGVPIHVNSGYRCPFWNNRVGGVRNSTHVRGIAADIRCGELTPAELARFAEEVPAFANGGIGVYKSWVHVDVRGKRARWRG